MAKENTERRKLVYIASMERSGSTWLSFVLGSHPRAATLGEHWRRFKGNRDSECRTCQHKGLPSCEMLHGITTSPLRSAYSLPLLRFAPHGVDTLVDNSKFLDWFEELQAAGACEGIDVRVIHLLRDPRGWITSETARNPGLEAMALLEDWKRRVGEYRDRLGVLGLPTLRVSYDMACLDPERVLANISEFIGHRYAPEHLRYWERVHHAMAGNGAAISVVPGGKGHTWDRGYYIERIDRVFHDDRWRQRLDPSQLLSITSDLEARRLMEDFGAGFVRLDELIASRDAVGG